jgi:hypothetical protein
VTDNREELEELVRKVVEAGAGHIITSCLDIPKAMKYEVGTKLEKGFGIRKRMLDHLYTDELSGRLHATIEYRRKLFTMMRAICDEHRVTMGLCMEFEFVGGKKVAGLNKMFMTACNCEGLDIPMYLRHGDGKRFEPVEGCDGNCLQCHVSEIEPACGIPDLKKASAWKLRDYRRWSKSIEARSAQQTRLSGE